MQPLLLFLYQLFIMLSLSDPITLCTSCEIVTIVLYVHISMFISNLSRTDISSGGQYNLLFNSYKIIILQHLSLDQHQQELTSLQAAHHKRTHSLSQRHQEEIRQLQEQIDNLQMKLEQQRTKEDPQRETKRELEELNSSKCIDDKSFYLYCCFYIF